MKHLAVFLIFLAGPTALKAEGADPLALKFHLMHPGELSAPGDPNAAFHLDGTAHLHYILRHPYDGKRSYSFIHVTSPDLLHWEWRETKLQPAFTGHGMFSGTGFLTKEGRPAVIYHGQGSDPARNFLAIAKDRTLSAWEKPYPIEVQGAPEGMRHWDPDCFLIGDTYYGISGGKDPSLFKSEDLKNWSYVGPFLSHEPEGVVLGEDVSCANFFPIEDPFQEESRWMLLCISHTHGCRYYLGDWDGEKEQFVPEIHGRLNWSQEGQEHELALSKRSWDFFAPESVLTSDGRRVMWAWMHSLDPALREKSIQSLPRELSLGEDGTLRVSPLQELETLRHDPRVIEGLTVTPEEKNFGGIGTERIFGMGDNAWEVRVRVPREEADRKRFGLRLFTDGKTEGLPITVQPATGTLRVGTTEAPFAVADLPEDEDVELTIFIDRYLVEVFVNDRVGMVAAHLEGRQLRGVDAFSWGAPTTFEKIEIWRMKSTTAGFDRAYQNQIWEPETETNSQEKASESPFPDRKDVLFIAIDDMNDWTTLFDPANPIQTPHLERLAARGAFFTRAYCASPGCNPSRTAIMTGLRPTTSGVYQNDNPWRKALPDAVTLPQYFASHGYATKGGGKILHHGRTGKEPEDNPSFEEFFPRIPYPQPQIREGAFGAFDWGPIPAGDMADTPMIEWAEGEMAKKTDQPLFLAAGLFMPHLPHFAPYETFERYPLDQVVMPPMPTNDLDDVPPLGIEMARREWNWKGYLFDSPPPENDPASLKNLVRGYQAATTYADEMVGRLLDQLDATGRADDTIIVLWSDHGYHLGDKMSTVKFTLWEKANRVPFIIVAPGITKPGTRIDSPVGLVNVYKTLAELAGLPVPDDLDGESLVPLLRDPEADWERPALMTEGRGNHAIRSRDWRYIRYKDGSEELYEVASDDPWNHTNLLSGKNADDYAAIVTEHQQWLPQKEAPVGPVMKPRRAVGERP